MFMGLVSNDFKNSVSSKLSQSFLGFSFFPPLPKALLPFKSFSYLYCLHHLYSWSSILLKLFFLQLLMFFLKILTLSIESLKVE